MALPTSGPLSIDDIATEFGGAAPHGLTEYYAADDNIPASGEIAITDFYGASNIPPPVARNFYDRNTHNAGTLGCTGSTGLIRSASTTGNYSGTTTGGSSTQAYSTVRAIAANGGAYMYWWNPAFYQRQTPGSYNGILDTDRLCRIQFQSYSSYGSWVDTVGNPSNATYGKLTSTAGNSTLHSSSGSTSSSPLVTYTTTQNLQWYIDNNEYIQFSIYCTSGNASNCYRSVGDGVGNFSLDKINFVI